MAIVYIIHEIVLVAVAISVEIQLFQAVRRL
jgi:hypothetical protein